MERITIAAIAGSLRKDSFNRQSKPTRKDISIGIYLC